MARGACMVGGVLCGGGACVARGHAWQGGMHGGEHVWQGACMAGGVCAPPADTMATAYGQ